MTLGSERHYEIIEAAENFEVLPLSILLIV